MVLLIVLVVAGGALALAVGVHGWSAAPFDSALGSLADAGYRMSGQLLADLGAPERIADVVAALVGLLLPGLVCVLLVEAVKAGVSLRRAAACVLLIGAGWSFWFVPPGSALVLCVLAVLAAVVLFVATGVFLLAPVAVATGFLAGRLIVAVLDGHLGALSRAAQVLGQYTDLGGYWAPVTAAVALLPVLTAATRLLRR